MTDATYAHVISMERPLDAIRKLGVALALMTETIEEPGASAMNEIIHTLLSHVAELDGIHETLFRLHHPSRERLFGLSAAE
jgi:hypothetical protein